MSEVIVLDYSGAKEATALNGVYPIKATWAGLRKTKASDLWHVLVKFEVDAPDDPADGEGVWLYLFLQGKKSTPSAVRDLRRILFERLAVLLDIDIPDTAQVQADVDAGAVWLYLDGDEGINVLEGIVNSEPVYAKLAPSTYNGRVSTEIKSFVTDPNAE